MTNPYRDEAAIEISGETYTLRATCGALAAIENDAQEARLIDHCGVRYALIALRHLSRAGGREIAKTTLDAMGVEMLGPVAKALNRAMNGGEPEKN